MRYLIYLTGLTICVICGISWHNICNFIDMFSFEFVVLPCILVLLTTGYWKGFIKAFFYIFDKVCLSSLIFGGVGVMTGLINTLHSLNIEPSFVGASVSVALIPMFYTLIINAILLPLYFELKK